MSEFEQLKRDYKLLKELYDNAVLQFKEADTQAHDLDRLVTAKQNEITRLHNVCHEYKSEINDLEKQIELKELSNATLLLLNRDLENGNTRHIQVGKLDQAIIKELKEWKEEAMIVMKDIPAIGRSIGVPLGETIHDKILPYIELLRDKLFPGAFLWWVHEQGWHKHSSGEYYYKSKDFHQWPPDEAITIEDLKVQFKALYNL